jgi:hypothetical protein
MAATLTRPELDIKSLDRTPFLAVLGKRVIHPGRRRSTEELFGLAHLQAGQEALDVGCGSRPRPLRWRAGSGSASPRSTW